MQNAQNLMSSFEFIAALMSIIIGLGVTNLLAGAVLVFNFGKGYDRSKLKGCDG